MPILTFKVPYPPATLNPNRTKGRHWASVAKVRKGYKSHVHWECRDWGVNRFKADEIHLHIQFHPPDNRRRDLDNAIAAFKAGQDAISDILGVDDSKFHVTYSPLLEADPNKVGFVVCRLSDEPLVQSVPLEGVVT